MATQYTPEEAYGGMSIFSKAVRDVKNTMLKEFKEDKGVAGNNVEDAFIKRLDEQLIKSQLPHISERDPAKLAAAKQEYSAARALFTEASDRHTAIQKGEKTLPGGTARFDEIFKELKTSYPAQPKEEKIELPPELPLPELHKLPMPPMTPSKSGTGR